jgi:hypothetical protein
VEIIMNATETETTTENLASLKEVREYFGLDGKQMVNQWRKLDETSRRDLRAGLADGSLTY